MVRTLFFALASAALTTAHFTLNWPPTAGFDDDNEPNAPCGGATVIVNSTSPQVQVDRFAMQIFSSHPAGSWQFLASTTTEEPYNFTSFATLNTTGIGNFCLQDFKVPDEYAGKMGVIQVIDDSPDGILYQCAPVQFVTGSNSTAGPSCTNQTGFAATWTTDSMSSNSFNSSSMSSSGNSTAATGGAAIATGMSSIAGLVLLAAGFAL